MSVDLVEVFYDDAVVEELPSTDVDVIEIIDEGPQGPQGIPGVSVGYYTETWRWTTNLVDASASGRVGLNQTTWAAATEVHLNEVTPGARDMALVIGALFLQNNKILLQDEGDATKYGLYLINGPPVDHGTWWTFPVTLVQGNGTVPSNNADTIVTILVTGGGGSADPLLLVNGLGVFGHAAPVAQPATPTNLNQVIALLQAYGLCA